MRAVAFYEHGGPEVLRVVEWPDPAPGREQVLLEVKACALNHLDVFVRRGMPGVETQLPHVSGGDIAGVVCALGEAVSGVSLGDRVLVDPSVRLENGREGALGENVPGGLCEYIAVPVANLLPLPESIGFEHAAALPIAYGTAHRMLFTRGKVRAGESVVVLGASGGVGTACVQLAKMVGATVIAVSRSDEKLEHLRKLGADHLVKAAGADFGSPVWDLTGKRGADVIVDYTGHDTWPASVRALARGGRILTCGATSGYEAVTDLRYVWSREETIIGANGWEREDLESLIRLVDQGRIEPVIDRILPLEEARAGHEALERREVFGKIIVVP